MQFGEEFRPIKLKRFVHGFPRKNQNDFGFQKTLDFKTFSVISYVAFLFRSKRCEG